MKIQCPQCKQVQTAPAQFCNNCGVRFAQPIKKKSSGIAALIILLTFGGLCVFCGLFGQNSVNKIKETPTETKIAPISGTPAPTVPPTFAELKTKANELLKFERNEYSKEDLKQFDEVMQPLNAIPKEDKNYKEAQALNKKIIDKVAKIAAEVVVLGEKPSEIELKMAFNNYLRDRLNDYDSSEYLAWSPAEKVTVKGEPFWKSVLRLRAKNGFGAYIVRDVTFYLRNKKVVAADGL